MSIELMLPAEIKESLEKFCLERNKGKSAHLEWEKFAISAFKMKEPPGAVDLLNLLEDRLKKHDDIDNLVEDYERIVRILTLSELLGAHDHVPAHLRKQHNAMLEELSKAAQPGGLPLGVRRSDSMNGNGKRIPVSMSAEMRQINPHILVLGLTGKGKSCFMARMIAHDIESGDRAVVIVDSDGALIDFIDNWVASHPSSDEFIDRITIIDPTCEVESPNYNPLEYPEDGDLHSSVSAVVHAFKAISSGDASSDGWTNQTAQILRNALMLLIINGLTLIDLPAVLLDSDFRELLLSRVDGQKEERPDFVPLLETWSHYKRLADSDQWLRWVELILNRVGPMLSDTRTRSLLTQRRSKLNLTEIIRERKILFVKIPQGQLEHSADLLGSMIITGLKRAALTLSQNEDTARTPCALYIDQFEDFVDWETVVSITSETKKFQIGFIGSSRTLQTLPPVPRNRIVRNVGTIALFALEREDAEDLAPKLLRLDADKMSRHSLTAIDQEKLHIERLSEQDSGTYFVYRVGTVSGIFNLQSPEFPFGQL